MLDITIRVTESSIHLKQIHQISVHNIAKLKDDLYQYNIYFDGKHEGQVVHYRKDGALILSHIVLNYLKSYIKS